MRIIQMSDLHYNAYKKTSLKNYKILKKKFKDSEIDLLTFCGDLLDKNQGNIKDAYAKKIQNLRNWITIYDIMITCGNHDIDRKSIKPMFKDYVKKIKSNEELDHFVKQDTNAQFSSNLSYISSYNELVTEKIQPDVNDDLYYIKYSKVNNLNLAYVSINTAWSSFDDSNYGQLLYPMCKINKIIKEIDNCDFKILVTHFPIHYLKEFNRDKVESKVFKNFDCIFCGHYHKSAKYINFESTSGIFNSTACSIGDIDDETRMGYIYHDINLETYSIQIKEYLTHEQDFVLHSNFDTYIPTDKNKEFLIKLYEKFKLKFQNLLYVATQELILPTEKNYSFLDLFTTPVLNYEQEINEITEVNKKQKAGKFAFENLYSSDHYVITGDDKSGKTSLLYKIYLDHLKNITIDKVVPVYIDMNEFYDGKNVDDFDLNKYIANQYSLSKQEVEKCISEFDIKILIDNFKQFYTTINDNFLHILQNCKVSSLIITLNRSYTPNIKHEFEYFDFEYIFIRNITRKEMRSFANKWPYFKNSDVDIDAIIDRVVDIFMQLNIHFDYWTVSLFFWIFEQSDQIHFYNNVELITLYIDNVLEKKNLALDRSKHFSFENYKDFLGFLAFKLYQNHESQNYNASYADLVTYYEQFQSSNIRITADPRLIFDYLLDKGIIYKVDNDAYSFRLNGVFEYFLAHYLYKNPKFCKEILNSTASILSFKNEIEIYSGLVRNDADLLLTLFYRCIKVQDQLFDDNPKLRQLASNEYFNSSIHDELGSLLAKAQENIKPLQKEVKDEIHDTVAPTSAVDSNVTAKNKVDLSYLDTDTYANFLSILCRVLRNLDAIEDKELVFEVFDFLINESCLLPNYFLHELEETESKQIDSFVSLFKNFLPILPQKFIYSHLSHKNFKAVIDQEISNLSTDDKQYNVKLFVLYFMYIEIDINNAFDYIDEFIEKVKDDRYILFSTSILLMFYILMYVNDNHTEAKLNEKLRYVNQLCGYDKNSIEQAMQRLRRKKLLSDD